MKEINREPKEIIKEDVLKCNFCEQENDEEIKLIKVRNRDYLICEKCRITRGG